MDTLKPFRRYFRWAALACSIASASLTAMFGLGQSEYIIVAAACALFLVACSLASDYINLFVVDAFRSRHWGMMGVFAAGAVFVFSLNLLSNLGSVGWQRDSVIKQAAVQNTRYDDARANVEENATNIALWKKQYAELLEANAWAGTVKADGLRAQVEDLRRAEQAEAKLGGCGQKCRAIQNQIAEVQGKIAVAEKAGYLESRIEATQRILDKHRAVSAKTKTAVAAPESQARFFASMATVSLAPSADAQTWTDRGIASWLALGLCVAPILFGLIGWKSDVGGQASASPMSPSLTPDSGPTPDHAYPLTRTNEPIVVHTVEQMRDKRLRDWSLTEEAQRFLARNSGQMQAA